MLAAWFPEKPNRFGIATIFAHLVREEGKIVAQGEGAATTYSMVAVPA